MFITDEDYRVVIGEQALKVVSQVSEENRVNAETEAVEGIAGNHPQGLACALIAV